MKHVRSRRDIARSHPEQAPPVHLNLNVSGLAASATLAANEQSLALAAQGHDVFRLALGQSPFPVPEEVVAALRANAHQKEYLAVQGLVALREAVAGYHHRHQGIERRSEDVLIGPGSKELMFLLQVVSYGDLVDPHAVVGVVRPASADHRPARPLDRDIGGAAVAAPARRSRTTVCARSWSATHRRPQLSNQSHRTDL